MIGNANFPIQFRGIFIACDRKDARVLTSLDDLLRTRCLPRFDWNSKTDSNSETQFRKQIPQHLRPALTHVEQLDTRFEEGILLVTMLCQVQDRSKFRLPASDWWPLFHLFPWEDWRKCAPAAVSESLLPKLYQWSRTSAPDETNSRRRLGQLFADGDQSWSSHHILARFQALYAAELLPEALRDRSGAAVSVRHGHTRVYGQTMAGEDRLLLAKALSTLRTSLRHGPSAHQLTLKVFTLGDLQKILENLTGIGLHTQNFRRDILRSGLLEPVTGPMKQKGKRPVKTYRWTSKIDLSLSDIPMPLPRKTCRC
jgi:hypothetical protein